MEKSPGGEDQLTFFIISRAEFRVYFVFVIISQHLPHNSSVHLLCGAHASGVPKLRIDTLI